MKPSFVFDKMYPSTRVLLLILAIYLGSEVSSQERPKIGLVLSGGGAKGVAHIGVLKAMEKAGLRPDYITGTSMGSIIGGLYAAGYSADELEELVLNIKWDEILTDKIPFNQISFPEKEFSSRYLLEFYMENGEIQLPKGLIEGQPLMEYFTSLTLNVQHIEEFKDLPIPFACVGADIVKGEPVLLNSGSLAQSMRASMALPSIFAPVKIDGKLLVDGGLLRNMPVNEVLDMGADIIIGVTVADDLDPEEKLKSAFDILVQATFIKSAYDTREQLKKCDYLIRPNLEGYSTGSFSEAEGIFQRGMDAGEKYYPTFKQLADSLNKLGMQEEVVKPLNIETIQLKHIHYNGLDHVDSSFVSSFLGLEESSTIGLEDIEEGIDRVVGSLLFESVYFEIESTETDSIYNLIISVKERPLNELRFSFHYDTDNKGGVLLNGTFRNLFFHNNRTILEADLAVFPRVTIDFLQYLNKRRRWALQSNSYYYYSEVPGIDGEGATNSILSSNTYSTELRVQNFMIRNSAIGAYGNWNLHSLNPKVADEFLRVISNISYSQYEVGLFFSHNSYNRRYFPTRGWEIDLRVIHQEAENASIELNDSIKVDAVELGDLYYNNPVSIGVVDLKPILPIGRSLSIVNQFKLRVADIPKDVINFSSQEYIGGGQAVYDNTNYYGAVAYEYSAYNYFYAYSGLQVELKHNLYTTLFYNYLESADLISNINPDGNVDNLGDRTARYAYGFEMGYLSPIGPLKLGVAKDHFRDNLKGYLSVGFYY